MDIEPSKHVVEPAGHPEQELVDCREIDAVAALHCGKKDTPKPPPCNITKSGCRPLAREPRHEAVVIDDHALVEAVADRLGLVMAIHLEAQSAAIDFDQLDDGRDLHDDRRRGAVAPLDAGADRALIRRQ
jgi:hypothetical protein